LPRDFVTRMTAISGGVYLRSRAPRELIMTRKDIDGNRLSGDRFALPAFHLRVSPELAGEAKLPKTRSSRLGYLEPWRVR